MITCIRYAPCLILFPEILRNYDANFAEHTVYPLSKLGVGDILRIFTFIMKISPFKRALDYMARIRNDLISYLEELRLEPWYTPANFNEEMTLLCILLVACSFPDIGRVSLQFWL